jgi:Protein of unknown function (DUF2939)
MVLVRAIDARDLNTVVQHINFDRVRVSLTEQMVTAYFRRSGTKPNPFAQQVSCGWRLCVESGRQQIGFA